MPLSPADRPAPRSGPFPLAPLAAAVLAPAAALALALALEPLLRGSAFEVFLCAVAVASWYGGVRAGLLAALLSAAANAYFFLAPIHSLRVLAPADLARLAVFAGVALVVSLLNERLRSAERGAREHAAENERLATQLQEQAVELEQQAEASQALTMELEEQVEEGLALRAERETASAEVVAARQRLAAILETMAEGVALVDGEGRVTFANAAARELGMGGHVPPGAMEVALAAFGAGGPVAGREVAVSAGGARRFLRMSASPLPGLGGETAEVVLSFDDVTERRRTEETLRESEARFRSLADTAPVLVWMADTEGMRTFFNKPWLDFTGRAEEQEAGEGWTEGVHPEDRRRCLAIYRSSLEARRTFRMEYRLRRADGEHRWVLDTGVPRFTPDGSFAGFIGSCIDITERREGEEQLRFLSEAGTVLASSLDYEETLRRVARLAVPVLADYCLVDLVDERGQVRRVEATHADAEMAPVVDLLRRYPPDPEGSSVVARVLRSGTPLVDNEVTPAKLARSARDEDHLEALLRLGATAYMVIPLLAGGRVLGTILLASAGSGRRYDEAELVRAEELARRSALAIDNARLYAAAVDANAAKADFMAVMSHELRTPLNAIIGYADLFLMGIPVPLPEAVVPQMERVRAAARHLLELIEEILTFARLEAGQEEVRLEPVECAEVVREAAALVEPLAIEKRLGFRAGCAEGAPVMRTDARKVRQVLVNLLGNAVKFTREGEVWLEAEPAGEEVLFHVGDTGIGISAEDRERIWDPFWQVEQTTVRTQGGSGLGLSVARQLARLLGGEITVESEPGRGSVFTVRLPVSPREAVPGTIP